MTTPQVGVTSYHPTAPYISTDYFRAQPTGLALDMLTPGVSDLRKQDEELARVILKASSDMDTFAYGSSGGVLWSSTDTEVLMLRLDRFGNFRLSPRLTPVVALTALSYGIDPANMTTVTDLSHAHVEQGKIIVPAAPFTGMSSVGPLQFGAIVTAARDMRVQYSYINGWPLTGLVNAVSAGAVSSVVKDPTGIYTGTTLMLRDVAQGDERIVVTGIAGNTLSHAALAHDHPAGSFTDALPEALLDACVELTKGRLKRRAQESVKPQASRGARNAPVTESPGDDDTTRGYEILTHFLQVRSR